MTGSPAGPLGPVLLALLGLALAAYGAARWAAVRRDRRYGSLVGLDDPGRPGALLRAPRWGIVGRPDEIRRLADGRWVPIEWKSRAAPSRGPYPSHRAQLLAYLALAEESTGRAPPFGVLRYAGGVEFRIPWDASARRELAELRAAVVGPYRGEHSASPAKCAGCRWREICDVRA